MLTLADAQFCGPAAGQSTCPYTGRLRCSDYSSKADEAAQYRSPRCVLYKAPIGLDGSSFHRILFPNFAAADNLRGRMPDRRGALPKAAERDQDGVQNGRDGGGAVLRFSVLAIVWAWKAALERG